MPKQSSKEENPKDINVMASNIVGEAMTDSIIKKNPAAVLLGRLGGLKGGKARAEKLDKSLLRLTSTLSRIIIHQRFVWSILMAPKYQRGQKVVMTLPNAPQISPRDSALESYAGRVGKVIDYHWLNMSGGAGVFYIYTVLLEAEQKEIVVHEDELAACIE